MLRLDLRRAGLLFAVGGAHAALALGLAHLHSTDRSVPRVAALETRFFQLERPVEEPPILHSDIEPLRVRIETAVPVLNIEVAPVSLAPPSANAPVATASAAPLVGGAGATFVENVQYVQPPKPRYPALSRRLKEQGVVVLKVLVNERGEAQQIEVADSSGHERLDRAAVEAVAAATFRPFLQNGTARAMLVLIPIEFGLHRLRT